MLLALDAGNSNLVAGLMDDNGNVVRETRTATGELLTKDGAEKALEIFAEFSVSGCILCSVVPSADEPLIQAVKDQFCVEVFRVGPELDTGLTFNVKDPYTIGQDLIAGAVGAVSLYGAPAIIFDLGTASTCCLVGKGSVYEGHLIYPGIRTGLDAQAAHCAKLPDIDLVPPESFVGKTTLEAMNSGALYSNASMIDGLTRRARRELHDSNITPVLTGGFAKLIAPLCEESVHLEEDLIPKGLFVLFEKNRTH